MPYNLFQDKLGSLYLMLIEVMDSILLLDTDLDASPPRFPELKRTTLDIFEHRLGDFDVQEPSDSPVSVYEGNLANVSSFISSTLFNLTEQSIRDDPSAVEGNRLSRLAEVAKADASRCLSYAHRVRDLHTTEELREWRSSGLEFRDGLCNKAISAALHSLD
jgi:hypothetical protein